MVGADIFSTWFFSYLRLERNESQMNTISIFMLGFESKTSMETSHNSVLGSDIYKLAIMCCANLRLIRQVSNGNNDNLVLSALYHCGDVISWYIYFFHEDKFFFRLVNEFDLTSMQSRYLLMHRLIGIGRETPELVVNSIKMIDAHTRLSARYPFKSISAHSFSVIRTPGSNRNRDSSADDSQGQSKKQLTENFVPAFQMHHLEQEEFCLTRNERLMLNRRGYLFPADDDISPIPGVNPDEFERVGPPHVYRGRQNSREVVCKKIRNSLELEYLERLNSDELRRDPRNVAAKLLDFYKDGSCCLLILPFYRVFTPGLAMYAARYSSETIDKVCTQLREFMAFLHEHHLAHLDIKPSNIGMEGSNLKVIDFGLMMEADADTVLQRIVGTKEFLPQDFINGTRKYKAFELDNYATQKTIEWLKENAVSVVNQSRS